MFHRCNFEARVDIASPDQPTKLVFYSCAFKAGRHVEIRYAYDPTESRLKKSDPAQSRMRPFADCPSDVGQSRAEPDFDQRRIELRLCHCDLAGRIVIRENPWALDPLLARQIEAGLPRSGNSLWPIPYDSDAGLGMNLCGSTLSGSLNLRWLRLKWINCERLTVLGGALFVNHFAFNPQRESWLQVPPETERIVFDELVGYGTEEPRFSTLIHHSKRLLEYSDKATASIEMMRRIAQQYDDLRKAFSNASNSYHHEDFCHYKTMMYKGEIERALLRSESRRAPSPERRRTRSLGEWTTAVLALAFTFLVVIALLAPRLTWVQAGEERMSDVLTVGGYAAIGLLILSNFSPKVAGRIRPIFEWLVFRRLFAYLVYPRRIISTAVLMIGFFALLYAALHLLDECYGGEQHPFGHIRLADTSSSSGKANDRTSESAAKARSNAAPAGSTAGAATPAISLDLFDTLVRSVHLSAVTFTTMGLYDMYPTGLMRVLSNLEAFVSALYLSMLTAAMARQVMRR
jgi:hypothetical protein